MRTVRCRDRGIAWCIVLTWHMLAVWVLVRGSRIEPSRDDAQALQVVYVATSVTAPALAATARANPALTTRWHRSLDRRELLHAEDATHADPVTPEASLPAQVRPLSAVFIDQARAWAQQQTPIDDFASRDPLARRPGPPPAAPAERFRMQPQRSLEDRIAAVGGSLFAPAGYDADPCPRNRENIGNLMTGHDPQALQQELDFERRHCRP